MGRHTDKFENSKMKLFAVLAIAVASRQVNQYGDNEVVIGGACTGDGSTECGLTNTECTAEVCACKEGFVEDTDKINCKAEVITDIGADCKAAPTWLRAAGDVCQCKDTFEPSKGDTKNCVTTIVPPKKIGDKCAAATECGTNASCEKPAADAPRADDTVCTCTGFVANADGVNCDVAPTGDSAAFYSVATAFMALILA